MNGQPRRYEDKEKARTNHYSLPIVVASPVASVVPWDPSKALASRAHKRSGHEQGLRDLPTTPQSPQNAHFSGS